MVAGVGNVFLGDDGFGVEVAQRLAAVPLPEGARAADFGIRGVHLAYELMNGYEGLVLIDAMRRGEPPGTLYVLEPGAAGEELTAPGGDAAPAMDAHDMAPETVLRVLRRLGVRLPWVAVLGCEPACLEEEMGLSPPVLGAVDEAVRLVTELLEQRMGRGIPAAAEQGTDGSHA
ncbi:hydrogenase maturation protease [Streptomyces sp. NPDC018019]|uniref:hydrogenase maturation protease n=1 Tax=Streptomyces sp. NPDC018019 TaxID=3365030 RepID=UPI0037B0DB04